MSFPKDIQKAPPDVDSTLSEGTFQSALIAVFFILVYSSYDYFTSSFNTSYNANTNERICDLILLKDLILFLNGDPSFKELQEQYDE